jgi:hypothetical protein
MIDYRSAQDGALGNMPATLPGVGPLARLIARRPELHEALHPRLCFLPGFPDAHPGSPSQPLVDFLSKRFDVRDFEAVDPSSQGLLNLLHSLVVAYVPFPGCKLLELGFDSGLGLPARSNPALAWRAKASQALKGSRADSPGLNQLKANRNPTSQGVNSLIGQTRTSSGKWRKIKTITSGSGTIYE